MEATNLLSPSPFRTRGIFVDGLSLSLLFSSHLTLQPRTSRMATFLALPVELQLAIISHIPIKSSSIRPNSSLLQLSRTSHHFHSLLTPLIDSKIQFSSEEQAHSYLRGASEETRGSLTSLVLKQKKKQSKWSSETVEGLLANVGSSISDDGRNISRNSRVKELRIEGGILRLNNDLRKLFKATLQDLVVLELDFNDDLDGHSTRVDYPQASNRVDYPSAAAGDLTASTSHDRGFESLYSFSARSSPSPRSLSTTTAGAGATAELELLATCCFELVQLESLKLCNANLTQLSSSSTPITPIYPWSILPSPSASPGAASPNLSSLDLVNCKISDETLLRLASTHSKLRKLSLRECTGYTSVGLGQVIKLIGGSLESLEISLPPLSTPQRQSPSRSSSPYSSPPRSPSRQSSLYFALDALLPSLPNLTSLSLSNGSLLSPTALARLYQLCPRLLHLSLDTLSTLSSRDLLPLLSHSSGLRSIHFTPATVSASTISDPSCSPPSPHLQTRTATHQEEDEERVLTELASLAITREVELTGEVFEKVKGRLSWAIEKSEEQNKGTEAGSKPTTRRKRPGIRM